MKRFFHILCVLALFGASSVFSQQQYVRVLDNIAALKRASVSDRVFIVLGTSTADDGGGGVFFWSSASAVAADDSEVVQSDRTSTGRWLRFDPPGTGGGTVSDGDKGDITISSSGTVWTLDTAVETASAALFSGQLLISTGTGRAGEWSGYLVNGAGELGGTAFSALTYVGVGEIATPATPDAGYGKFYFKSDGKPYALNDSGTEVDLTSPAPTGTMVNTGVSTQYALPKYNDATGTNVVPSNVTSSADGNDLNVPGNLNVSGDASFNEFFTGTLYLSNIVAGSLLKVVDDGGGNVYVTNAVAGVDYPAVPEILTTVTDGSTNLVDSDAIYDAIAAGGGSSPTTTRGDLIRRGAATDERLAVGSFGDGLLSDGTDPAWYAPQNYVRRFDDFTTTSGTVIGETGWTSALANSGTAAAGTGESGRPGVWVLSTTTSGTASALLVRQFLSDVFGGGVMRFECSIKLSALSDGTDTYTAMFGWFDTSSTSPTDGAYIRYTHSVNSGNWQGITRSNSSETPVNGSVAASTSWTKLGIQVAADGSSVEFFVDGVSIGTSSATIPTGAGRETGLRMGIIKSAGTTARTVSLDYTSELFKPTSTR
jgi:hypothetical protein